MCIMRAHKEFSTHPTSGTVTSPVDSYDARLLQNDVDDWLQILSMVEALRNGQLPNNAQLDAFLLAAISACRTPAYLTPTLSSDTRKALTYARDLLETWRLVLKEKNADELIQDTLFMAMVESRGATSSRRDLAAERLARAFRGDKVPVDNVKDFTARPAVGGDTGPTGTFGQKTTQRAVPDEDDLEQRTYADDDLDRAVNQAAEGYASSEGELVTAARHVRTLFKILFMSGEVRAAITDLIAAGRNLAKDNFDKVKAKTMAPNNGAQRTGTQELPSMSRYGTKSRVGDKLKSARDRVADQAQSSATSYLSDSEDDFYVPGAFFQNGREEDEDDDEDDEDDNDIFDDALSDLSDYDGINATKPDAQTSEVFQRFKIAINRIQENDGYVDAMKWVIEISKAYEQEVVARYKNSEVPLPMTPTRRILSNCVTILERFARGRSLSGVQKSILNFYGMVEGNPDLKALWEDIDAFIAQVLVEKGYINTESCSKRGTELWNRLNSWFQDELYAAKWNAICTGLWTFLGFGSDWSLSDTLKKPDLAATWFADDPLTSRLEKDWTKLTSALFLDSRDKFVFKRHLWTDVASFVLPKLHGWGYIPFPRVEYASPAMEIVLENVFVSFANIMPSIVSVKEKYVSRWSPFEELKEECRSGNMNRLEIRVEQIQADVRGALASLKWMKGITIVDSGLVDILLSRGGISLFIDIDINTDPRAERILTPHSIKVEFDEFNIYPTGTHRDTLYRILIPAFLMPMLKRKWSASLAKKLEMALERIDAELVVLRNRFINVNTETEARRREGDAQASGAGSLFLQVLNQRLKELKVEATKAANQKLKASAEATELALAAADAVVDPKGAIAPAVRKELEAATATAAATAAATASAVETQVNDGERKQPQMSASAPASRRGSMSSTHSDDSTSSSASSASSTRAPDPGGLPFKRKTFKISYRLEDAILPLTTQNRQKSILYRRRAAESAARRAADAADAIDATTFNIPVATTGLSAVHKMRPWRSPVFSADFLEKYKKNPKRGKEHRKERKAARKLKRLEEEEFKSARGSLSVPERDGGGDENRGSRSSVGTSVRTGQGLEGHTSAAADGDVH